MKTYPVDMRIARNVNVIPNFILIHVLERAVLVCTVGCPRVPAETQGTVFVLLLDVREDKLVANDAPSCATVLAR